MCPIYSRLIPSTKIPLRLKFQIVEERKVEAGEQRQSFADLERKVQEYKVKIQSAVTHAEGELNQKVRRTEKMKKDLQDMNTRYVFPYHSIIAG